MIKTNCTLARRYGKHLQWYGVKNLKLLTAGHRGRTIKKSLERQHSVRPQSTPKKLSMKGNPHAPTHPNARKHSWIEILRPVVPLEIFLTEGATVLCLPSLCAICVLTCGKINHKYGWSKSRGKFRQHHWKGTNFKRSDKSRNFLGGLNREDISGASLAYHDNSPGLLCGAHAHDGCHADGGSLEINPTEKHKEGLSLISCIRDAFPNVSNAAGQACHRKFTDTNSPRRGIYWLGTFFFLHYTLLFQLQDGPIILVEFRCPDSDSGQALLCIRKLQPACFLMDCRELFLWNNACW